MLDISSKGVSSCEVVMKRFTISAGIDVNILRMR